MSEYIAISEQLHKRWVKELTEYGILYIYAMTGYGKTVQAEVFAQENFRKYIRISAADKDFIDKVKSCLSENSKAKVRTLIILDDLQWLRDEKEQKCLFELLHATLKDKSRIRVMILSRAALPAYLTPFQVTKNLIVEGRESLSLDKDQIRDLIMKEGILDVFGNEQLYSLIQKTESVTTGYGLAVHSYLTRMKEYPDDETTAITLATQDVWNYIDAHLFEQWPPEIREAAITLSVYEEFTVDMAEHLLGDNAKSAIDDFVSVGSFLSYHAPDNYRFFPFFHRYLNDRMRNRPEEERIALYEKAAECYDGRRDYENVLRCYKEAGRVDKISEYVIFLSEIADGCSFARISEQYMQYIPDDWEEQEPGILGAKVMLAAYRMRPDEADCYFGKLKKMAEEEQASGINNKAMETYVRTVIAYPCTTSEKLKDNLKLFTSYVKQNGIKLKNIIPTGNMPSLINGGLDLLSWEKNKALMYPFIKTTTELFIGKEAVGIADVCMGEVYYEQNKMTRAMASLTKALSLANLRGSIRVQYAVTGIMARVFTAEEQLDTAIDILENIRNKAIEQNYRELVPNIEASLVQGALYMNDADRYQKWLDNDAISEHDDFYITARYQLFVKAKVYTALGRDLDALYIIGLLQEYTTTFERIYFDIDLAVLQAIILYRRGEDWMDILQGAVDKASEYGLVRILADYGAALLPLWKELKRTVLDNETRGNGAVENLEGSAKMPDDAPLIDVNAAKLDRKYLRAIDTELKQMANYYPDYLKNPRRLTALTDKEMVVLKLVARGLNNSQIAEELQINIGTVKFHVKNIMTKLEAKNRTVAVKIAQDEGIL